ncbi:MAG: DUF2163 domain-containing protein [Alphaproteobacteria bacterium]|nr:DUF2163 domain-containing protein [Alphaproteobacteria bacterium]
MKPFSAGLDDVLAGWGPGSPLAMADLYTFVLAGGETLRLSGAQIPISTGAFAATSVNAGVSATFALGPGFSRSKTRSDIGVQVGELDIAINAGGNDRIGTLNWQQAMRIGLFDGAVVELDRAFMQPYGVVQGTAILFYGRTGEISVGRTRIDIKAVDMKDLLKIQMPRRLYQAGCNHIFGDVMCGFDRLSLAATVACLAGSSQAQIATGLSPSPATLYDQGTIAGVTGQNAGYVRTVSRLLAGAAYLLKPFFFSIAAGDRFTLLPGCDHTVATCQGTFDNLGRYGGFPYIPPPETAL